jgi:hypothetical protein
MPPAREASEPFGCQRRKKVDGAAYIIYAVRVNTTHWNMLAAVGIALFASAGCNGGPKVDTEAETNKKALEAAPAVLKEPVALIASYMSYMQLSDAEKNDKYAPKRHNDAERVWLHAANEIRFSANRARQNLTEAPATKELLDALRAVTASCADLQDPSGLDKCGTTVTALDAALKKTGEAAAAAGVTAKIPRVAPDAITDDAKKSIASFLRAKGPGSAEKAFVVKRAEAGAAIDDVIQACQAAADETGATYTAFEKAEEPLRVIAVTHKMAVESQCNTLKDTDHVHKEVLECGKKKKKPRTSECNIACGKAKTKLDDGLPSAAFAPMEKDYAEVCPEEKKP